MELDNLPFTDVLRLYREKILAEKLNDQPKLKIMRHKYPDLFLATFDDFIEKLAGITQEVDKQHGTQFTEALTATRH
ncbi:MAG: hypothetical protein WAW86_09775 [Gammaproteobacteria bacterium]